MPKALSDLVIVNPQVDLPGGGRSSTMVSFIPMSDVTESGDWIGDQVRRLGVVGNGFTSFADDDVLVAKITPCFENGKGVHVRGLVNGVGFGSTEFHVLRARENAWPRYVHHVVQSERFRSASEAFMSGSAGQRRVQREAFDVHIVPDLSLPEQKLISQILDTLDTTIRQTAAIIEKLKQVKQGLLHDLLTRGIGANGELRPPQSQAPELYKESVLGWIPREWDAVPLSTISLSVGDGVHYAVKRSTEGVPFLFVSCIRNGEIDWQSASFVSQNTYREISKKSQPKAGMVLFTVVGSYGHAAHVDNDLDFGFERNIAYIVPNRKVVDSKYLCHYMSSAVARAQVERLVIGNAQKVLTLLAMNGLVVFRPPLNEQAQLALVLDSLSERVAKESEVAAKLRLQKSGLMDDLLTGRVRVTPLLQEEDPA